MHNCAATSPSSNKALLAWLPAKGPSKIMSALYPALRVAHYEHHYVFCLPRENAPALIVAIFHERMDLMTRLIDRLK